MSDLEQAIRERAYHLWMEGGCLDGNAEAHWLSAQREVMAASLGAVARVINSSAAEQRRPQKAKGTRKRRVAA